MWTMWLTTVANARSPGQYLPGAQPAAPASWSVQGGGFVDLIGEDSFGAVAAGASVDAGPSLEVEALGGYVSGAYGDAAVFGGSARWRLAANGDRVGVAPWVAGGLAPYDVELDAGPVVGAGVAVEGGGTRWRGDVSIPLVVAAPRDDGWGVADPLFTLLDLETGVRWEGRGGRDEVRIGTVGFAPTVSGRYGVGERLHVSAAVASLFFFTGFHAGLGGTFGQSS